MYSYRNLSEPKEGVIKFSFLALSEKCQVSRGEKGKISVVIF
jgi:hypothetical protein